MLFCQLMPFFISSLTAFLVLCIISSMICIPLIVFAGFGVSYINISYTHAHDRYSLIILDLAKACYGFQIFVALLQAGVAIAASGLSCKVVCCFQQDYSGAALYLPVAPSQPQLFMILSPNQLANSQQFFTVAPNQAPAFTQSASPMVEQPNGKIKKCFIMKA